MDRAISILLARQNAKKKVPKTAPSISEKLDEFYDNEVPGYVCGAGKTYMVINVDDCKHKITIEDVARYYAHEACNISSGLRTISSVSGDWRCIDSLANETLSWFKFVNIDGIRKAGAQHGLEARF